MQEWGLKMNYSNEMKLRNKVVQHHNSSIHAFSMPLALIRMVGDLEPIRADFGQEAGYTLD